MNDSVSILTRNIAAGSSYTLQKGYSFISVIVYSAAGSGTLTFTGDKDQSQSVAIIGSPFGTGYSFPYVGRGYGEITFTTTGDATAVIVANQ